MDKKEKLESILRIEKELKMMLYAQSRISLKDISDARTLRMVSFVGRVKSNKKLISFNEENTHELYFVFDRFVALELNNDGRYAFVWDLYPYEVENIDKMILDAEKLAGFE